MKSDFTSPRKRRLFFALWPTDEVRRSIERETQAISAHCDGRIIPSENLHVTVAFLGAVPEAQLPAVMQAGANISAPAFELSFDCVELWRRSALICLTASHMPEPLRTLVDGLQSQLLSEQEHRDYRPHVTLIRDVTGRMPPISIPPLRWIVEELVLCESHPRSTGSKYEVLSHWPLTTTRL